MKKLLFIGLDVHAKSIAIGLAEGAGEARAQLKAAISQTTAFACNRVLSEGRSVSLF